jgi:hypothetical protein
MRSGPRPFRWTFGAYSNTPARWSTSVDSWQIEPHTAESVGRRRTGSGDTAVSLWVEVRAQVSGPRPPRAEAAPPARRFASGRHGFAASLQRAVGGHEPEIDRTTRWGRSPGRVQRLEENAPICPPGWERDVNTCSWREPLGHDPVGLENTPHFHRSRTHDLRYDRILHPGVDTALFHGARPLLSRGLG